MKYRFLLDENILHFAIKGVNERDEPAQESAELLSLIFRHCHRIVINPFLAGRYWVHVNQIIGARSGVWATEAVKFINDFLKKAEKRSYELDDCPELPAGVAVPAEDVEIVRFALLTKASVITGDTELREAINQYPEFGFRALRPVEAIVLARET